MINFGIVPLTFEDPTDYDRVEPGDSLDVRIDDLKGQIVLVNVTKGIKIGLTHTLSQADAEILKAGGKLPWIKQNSSR